MGLCEHNMIAIFFLLYQHTEQAWLRVPDYVTDDTWKLKLACQSVLYILSK